jgi:hypothetical protein
MKRAASKRSNSQHPAKLVIPSKAVLRRRYAARLVLNA